jgi:tRNA-2-methylthio-N6-dimethylallyladenosine synthase
VQILVEGPSKKNPARLMGRTRCNKIVLFEGSHRHRGQIMDVEITRAGSFTLYGDPAILNLDNLVEEERHKTIRAVDTMR